MAQSLGVWVCLTRVSDEVLEAAAQMFMGNYGRLDSVSVNMGCSSGNCVSCNNHFEGNKCDTESEIMELLNILDNTEDELRILLDQAMEMNPAECKQSASQVFKSMLEKIKEALKNCTCQLSSDLNNLLSENAQKIENYQTIEDLLEVVEDFKAIILINSNMFELV